MIAPTAADVERAEQLGQERQDWYNNATPDELRAALANNHWIYMDRKTPLQVGKHKNNKGEVTK